MKKLMIAALMVVGFAGNAMAAGDAAAGKAKVAACAACHGADGNSAAPTFPKLAGQSEKYLIKQLSEINRKDKTGKIIRAVPAMTGQTENMSAQDIADVAAFFAGQKMSGGAAKKEKIALGAEIYRSGDKEKGLAACSGCHSPTGQGNAPAGFPKLGGQHADYIVAQLKAFRTGADDAENAAARTNDGDTRIMRDIAYRLSDKEIDSVASYISGLH
jgi:cytochrome c553